MTRWSRRIALGGSSILLGALALWLATGGATTARDAGVDSMRQNFAPAHVLEAVDELEPPPAESPIGDLDDEPELTGPPPPDLPPVERPQGLRGTSLVLLMGLDNRDDRRTGRADTIILVAFRHRDGRIAAFSIPRDLYMELPELGPARINSTVRIGEYKLGRGEGVPLLRRVIEDNFGVHIDHYARVDHAGFVAAVDALGGVEIELQCPIRDCFWGEDRNAGCEMLDLEAGPQVLDGHTALLFSRSRHGRGEKDRRRRQQMILMGLANEVRSQGLRAAPRLWSLVREHIETDLDLEAALYYASFVLDDGLEDIGGFSITRDLVERHVTEDGKHVLLLQPDAFDQALERLFATPLPGLRRKRRCPALDVALSGADH
jgi:LCP family protein required for cell wall assembly